MLNLRATAAAAAFGIVAAFAPQAHATLIIDAGGSVGPGGVITGGTIEATDPTNTGVSPLSFSMGGFDVNAPILTGVRAFGGSGELMEVGSLDTSTSGSGSLTLFFIETGLTGTSPAVLSATLTGIISNVSVTRSIYFDPTDTGAESDLLLTSSGTGGAASNVPFAFNSTYALIEEIDLTATGAGAAFGADDSVSLANPVPEPGSLALLLAGSGLLGLIRRRGRL